MKTKARWTSGIAVVSLIVLGAMTIGLPVAHGQAATVRWDIISVDFATGTLSAGGIASARANDCVPAGSTNCSKITLTGSGPLFAPPGGERSPKGTTRRRALGTVVKKRALPGGGCFPCCL